VLFSRPTHDMYPPSISAGLAGFAVDRLVETKGVSRLSHDIGFGSRLILREQLDFVDAQKAKHQGEY
jgi:hypothetical protein